MLQVLSSPVPGDLVIWQYEGASKGHIGIVTALMAHSYRTIEGNTGPSQGYIEREGDGVYEKVRHLGGVGKMKELGFLTNLFNKL